MPRNTFSVGMLRGATPGLSRLAQQIGGGDTSYQQGYDNELGLQSKLGMQLAQMRNADASARAHDATAQQTGAETAILTDRPNQFREQVANAAGSDGPTVDAYRQKLRTGQAPQVPMGPPAEDGAMGVGSQQFDPALQSKLAQAIKQFAPMLFNQKDMKPDDLAQADATYNKTGLLNSAVAGAIDRNRLGGAVAATEGKPLFHVSGDGGVLDQYTGNLNEQGGLAQSTIGLKKAQTGAQDASAKNSIAGAAAHYASADNSRASAARTRLDIEQGVRTGQIQVITDNDGNVSLLNKATGVSRPATSADGVPLKGKSVSDKPLTEGQAKDNGYGSRMMEADRLLNGLAGKYWPAAVNAKVAAEGMPLVGGLTGGMANLALTEEGQQAEQAQRDFINAVLRRESGAVISPSEFANANKQYFVQPNDKPGNIAQKARNRQLAIEGVLNGVPVNKRGLPSLTNPAGAGGGKNVSVDY